MDMQAGIGRGQFSNNRRYDTSSYSVGIADNLAEIMLYVRLSRGYGDAIMLRPAIIASIRKWPNVRHIAHLYTPIAPMFEDIDGLEIITIDGDVISDRFKNSNKLIESYSNFRQYKLTSPCYEYEVANSPYIYKSRQEIFCSIVGVDFDVDNYNVHFTNEENEFADNFLRGLGDCIGLHFDSAQLYRSYRYVTIFKNSVKIKNMAEYIAKRHKGTVITFDPIYEYQGRVKNIESMVSGNIRKVWAVMSRMKLGFAVDSFGVHGFGSTEVPTYGMFGATNPRYRLLYKKVNWAPCYEKCGRQYCWYNPCESVPCLNLRFSSFYWKDSIKKMGPYIGKNSNFSLGMSKKLPVTIRKKSKIALVMLEGLGATATLTDHAEKIHSKFGIKPHVIIRRYPELFDKNPHIDGVTCVGDIKIRMAENDIIDSFDNTAFIKTGIGRWHHKNEDLSKQNFSEWEQLYKFHPLGLREVEKYKLNLVQLANKSLGLPYDTIDIDTYNIGSWEEELPYRYVVVANGVDELHHGKTLTKSWPQKQWKEFISKLEYSVVQVGTRNDTVIKGIELNLLGKTDIPQLFYILKNAAGVVCNEGGIMHLAYAVKAEKIFVLRGPTKGYFYYYPKITFIDSEFCDEGCYWDTMDWAFDCPKGFDAECMKMIDSGVVAGRVNAAMGLL